MLNGEYSKAILKVLGQEVETWHVYPFSELPVVHKNLLSDWYWLGKLLFFYFLLTSITSFFFNLSVYALVYGGNSHREENIIVPPFSAPISARYRVNQIGWADESLSVGFLFTSSQLVYHWHFNTDYMITLILDVLASLLDIIYSLSLYCLWKIFASQFI